MSTTLVCVNIPRIIPLPTTYTIANYPVKAEEFTHLWNTNGQLHPENESFVIPPPPVDDPEQPEHFRYSTIQLMFAGTTWVRLPAGKDGPNRLRKVFPFVLQEQLAPVHNMRMKLLGLSSVAHLRRKLDLAMGGTLNVFIRDRAIDYYDDEYAFMWWDELVVTDELLEKPQDVFELDVNIQSQLRTTHSAQMEAFLKIRMSLEKELSNNPGEVKKDRVMSLRASQAVDYMFSASVFCLLSNLVVDNRNRSWDRNEICSVWPRSLETTRLRSSSSRTPTTLKRTS